MVDVVMAAQPFTPLALLARLEQPNNGLSEAGGYLDRRQRSHLETGNSLKKKLEHLRRFLMYLRDRQGYYGLDRTALQTVVRSCSAPVNYMNTSEFYCLVMCLP